MTPSASSTTIASAAPAAEAPVRGDVVRIGATGYPAHSLAPVVARWARQQLRQPDGPEAGTRWRFTLEQARFLLWWYAIDDEGRWIYRRGTLRRMKGWGEESDRRRALGRRGDRSLPVRRLGRGW